MLVTSIPCPASLPSRAGPRSSGHHGAAPSGVAAGGDCAPRVFTLAPAGLRPECHLPHHLPACVCVARPAGRQLQQPQQPRLLGVAAAGFRGTLAGGARRALPPHRQPRRRSARSECFLRVVWCMGWPARHAEAAAGWRTCCLCPMAETVPSSLLGGRRLHFSAPPCPAHGSALRRWPRRCCWAATGGGARWHCSNARLQGHGWPRLQGCCRGCRYFQVWVVGWAVVVPGLAVAEHQGSGSALQRLVERKLPQILLVYRMSLPAHPLTQARGAGS